MKKILIGIIIGLFIAVVLSAGTNLFAQERGKPQAGLMSGPIVVLGGLKLTDNADSKEAEALLKEKLIPEMSKIDGLDMRILKRMPLPGSEKAERDPGAYDYIMLAEMGKLQVFMQLTQMTGSGLREFGDMMKKHAGEPYINIYSVMAKTKEDELN
ncbi:hypothetical protein GF312_09740 [Candidatus Poribacteria bacterium]|nr:hypothetical protein [Candidatus Poribacteria bacterium]